MKLKPDNKPHIMTVGGAHLEMHMRIPVIPGPGTTVMSEGVSFRSGGGAGLIAVALARLQCRVFLLSAVGTEPFGNRLMTELKSERVNVDYVERSSKTATGITHYFYDPDGRFIRVLSPGAAMSLSTDSVLKAKPMFSSLNLLIVQMDVSSQALELALEIAGKFRIPVLFNPTPIERFRREWVRRADVLALNAAEAESLLGRRIRTMDDALNAVNRLLDEGAGAAALTLGIRGVAAGVSGEGAAYFPAMWTEGGRPFSAGAAFLAGLAAALGRGEEFYDACGAGIAAAGLSVRSKDDVFGFHAFGDLDEARRLSAQGKPESMGGPET